MPQSRESGAAGAAYGLMMAKGLASLLGAELRQAGSNEVLWGGRPAVIKSCRPGTSSFGITAAMLPRLEQILVGLERADGQVTVVELPAERFRAEAYQSRSRGGDNKVLLVRRALAEREGRQVAAFQRSEVERAASATQAPDDDARTTRYLQALEGAARTAGLEVSRLGRNWLRLGDLVPGSWVSVSVTESRVQVNLNNGDDQNRARFLQLYGQRTEIQDELPISLLWENKPGVAKTAVRAGRTGGLANPGDWPEQHVWAVQMMARFVAVFGPRLADLETVRA